MHSACTSFPLSLRSLNKYSKNSNVLNYDTEDHQDLETAHSYDLVTSAVIYDATFSGYNSIILGTFGKVVLFYSPLPINADMENSKKITNTRFRYELKREYSFKHSIMGLCKAQISINGAYYLVILTLNGLSVWQYDPDRIADLINQKFEENEQFNIDRINAKLKHINH